MNGIAQRLFDWWHYGKSEPAALFVPEFSYRGVSKAVTGEDWLYLSVHGVRWTDVVVLAISGNSSWGAVAFEGIDPATGLKNRVCWLVQASDDRIHELIETIQSVE